jgi:type III secretory pathway lipoprotein EscJ
MTFTYPMELAVLRTRLEADGIECLVLDELTVQANPLYSNAVGGVKLQVRESDIQKAVEILKDGGYI